MRKDRLVSSGNPFKDRDFARRFQHGHYLMETGIRVSLNTHAPLTLPGMLSTAGHCDQSRFAIIWISFLGLRQSAGFDRLISKLRRFL
jgi:hypothetical protein